MEATKEKMEEAEMPSRRAEQEESSSAHLPRRTEDLPKLESQLRSEHRIKELKDEVTRLNDVVGELNGNLQRSVEECYKKEDWVRRLERTLHEERNRQEEASAHFSTLLEDKDAQIHEYRRCLEAQKIQMSHLLEEHSRAGQSLAQILEKERRDWILEREMLQSELYGTQSELYRSQQQIQEQEHSQQQSMEEAKNRAKALEVELMELRAANEELKEANESLRTARPSSAEQRRTAYEKEISENMEEIAELKMKMSKVNDRIEENFQRTEAEMTSLRHQLTETIEERDKLVAELHTMREKEMHRSARGSSMSSSVGGSDMISEKQQALEGKVEDLRFELEEARAISQATQEHLEEQLRINRQLDIELNQLRQNVDQTASKSSKKSLTLGLDVTDHVYRLVMQLQDTLLSAQSQTAGIVAKKSSSQTALHASSLNISLEEARHQIETVRSTLESAMGGKTGGQGESSSRRPPTTVGKKHRSILTLGRWSSRRNPSSKQKVTKDQLKEELEEMRKEVSTLNQERFALEQCIRYLSSRCQMYQTAWKAREGQPKKHHRRVASQSREGASTSGTSGEIQIPEAEVGNQPEIASVHSGSDSPREEGGRNEGSPRLSRNLELKLIHKISSICEPFYTQHSESSVCMMTRPRALREVSSFAS